ncbi:lamin tail domain-containing protein [Luteolibacter sp. Populi]|uniref:lamin tail domain-containing protein n=1 Tax=Luteolibacter sp. Populi TaxID=3230487 RepID=UPI0034651419
MRSFRLVLATLCVAGTVASPAAQTNLAAGKPVFATGATYPGYPASNLTDGTAETFAHPNLPSNTLGFYFQIDLQATQELERIVLTGRGDGCCIQRLTRYQVEVRADNNGQPGAVNWTGILRSDGSFPAVGGSDTIEAADGSGSFAGRFLRIVNVSDDLYNPQIAEVMVFGVPGPEIPYFGASAGNISASGNPGLPTQTTLSWETDQATALSISPTVGIVPGPAGSLVVQPATTTTYTLTAARGAALVQSTVTIGVDAPFIPPVISEMVASNDGLLEDEDGEDSDWVEIRNPNSYSLNLKGAHLTDKSTQPEKWAFPDAMLPPGGYLVVFASSKDRVVRGRALHTNFSLSEEGEYLGLHAPGGAPVWSAFSPGYPAQKEGLSYGIPGSGTLGFFSPATPGAANAAAAKAGFVVEPVFSKRRGFYTGAQSVAITCATPGATIRYTTNGSLPTDSNGTTYSAPLNFSNTTILRATAFAPNFVPSRTETATYIFPAGVIASGVMRTSITQDPTYGPQMNAALLDLPSMSLVAPGPLDGDIETAASIEFLDPAVTTNGGAADVEVPHANAGVKYFGGEYTNFDKKNFRLAFRGIYGDGKLNGNLFPDRKDGWLPADSFDSIELRSGSHDMWMRGFYLSNPFTDDVVAEMGSMQPHGRMVHLYLNGVYHGVYHLRERWGAAMASSYLGGDKQDYESINGNQNVGGWADPGSVYDGDGTAWERVKAMRGDYPAIAKHVDVDNYLDYMIMWMFGNAENEYRVTGPSREDGGSGLKFMLNDADGWLSVNESNQISAWDGNQNNTARAGSVPGRDNGDGPASLLSAWLQSGGSEFKIRFADRIQRHLGPGGTLSPERNAARLTTMAAGFVRPHLAESARWNFRTPDNWNGARDVCLNGWLPGRTQTVLTQFRNAGFFPAISAPSPTSSLASVSVSGSGTILFTKDGSDPRLAGGLQNPLALTVASGGSIALDRPTRLKLRAKSAGGEWSALAETFFVPQGQSALPAGSVVVSELNYQPAGEGNGEFLELTNISTQAVNLRGAEFTSGIGFAFSSWRDTVLEPGKRLVIVDSDYSFRDRYGWDEAIVGIYRGSLNNDGEQVTLANSAGTAVLDFDYYLAVSEEASGGGKSLLLLPPYAGADLSAGSSWATGPVDGGQPNEFDLQTYAGGNPDGDDDGDGTSNFVHYALAGTGELRLPEIAVTAEGPHLTVYANALAADAEVVIQASSGLVGWETLSGATLVSQEVSAGIRKTEWLLPPGYSARFVRLKVTAR